ncbi:MAG: hypothetical protein IT368_07150, partial [Candidatus Hydrogenedentes bacterium]|nr:hypothetical protein [Candidatus Hydrogenedentota bacterium]
MALVLLAQVYAVASDSVVLSPTHPDSEAWYFTRHFQAHWPAYHPAATGYRWSIDQQPDTPVAEDATLAGSLEIDVAVDADGSWYLHLAAVDAAGIIAGSQIDYRFNVHTAPPTITSPSHPDSGTTMSRSEFQAQARLPRDGNTWTSVVGSAGEPVVFKGKIWRFERSTFSNANIWWSDDGMQWNYVDVHPGLPRDWRVKVLVHEGAIWLFGSQGLWRSEDGIRWTEFGPAGGWRKYRRFAVASFAGKLWVLGGDVEVMGSDWYTGKPILYHDVNDFVWSSEDGVHWDMHRAPWPARSSAIAAVYNNQLWIMGGSPSDYDYKALTDIWSTEDGQTWVRRAGVAPVAIADPLVFQDKLWLIRAGATMPHTIWCTSDGSTWTQSDGLATKIVYDTCGLAPVVFQGEFWAFTTGTDGGTNTFRSANGFNWTPVSLPYWRPRASHGSTVFKDQLWITGGTDGTVLNDVWSSTDGIAWDQVTPAAPWPPRSEHGTAVFADKLWVMGGTDGNAWLKDVWQSADGKEWSLVTENAPFSKVRGQAFVFRNRLWLVGDNNLWHTGDGAHWAAVPQDPPWKRDSGLKVAVLNDRLYLCAGSTQSSTEYELWVSIDGVSWQKFEIAQGSKSITSFQNEIWLLGMRQYFLRGGYYPMPEYIDDYNQQIVRFDPLSGVTADTNAPAWRIRTSHAATAFDGTLWVLGGSPISGDIVWHLGSEALPVYKYRYTVDTMPDTVPTASAASSTLGRFNVPGNTLGEHWFHVAAVDALDNATAPAHYRFVVGNGPPVVMSPSHPDTVRGYTGQEVTFFWSSGEETDTRCYYYSVDQSANGIPNQMTTDTSLSLTCLEPGTYWLHLARLSTSGLASEIVHHQIIVAGGPTPLITSVSHPTEGTPYVARTVSLNWSYPYQPYACHYVWDQEPLTDPDQDSPQTSDTTLVIENA